MFSFGAEGDSDLLSITEGQSDLELLSDEEGEDPASPGGWVRARSAHSGRSGLVPASYVRAMPAESGGGGVPAPPSPVAVRPGGGFSPTVPERGPLSPRSVSSSSPRAVGGLPLSPDGGKGVASFLRPGLRVVLAHDFEAQGDPELLSVREGSSVLVEHGDFGDGWFLAVATDGGEERSGLLPTSYVRAEVAAASPQGGAASPSPPPAGAAAAGPAGGALGGLVARCEEVSYFEIQGGEVLRRGREGKVFVGKESSGAGGGGASAAAAAEMVSMRLSGLEGCQVVMLRKGALAGAATGGAEDEEGDEGCFEGAAVLSAAAGPLEVMRYYNWAPNGAPTVQARLRSQQRGADTLICLEFCTHPRLPEGACVATDIEFAVECRPAELGREVGLDRAAPRACWHPSSEAPTVCWAFPRLEARHSGELRAVLRNARLGSLRARVSLRRAGGRPVVTLRAAGEAHAPGGSLAPLAPASFLSREAIAVLPSTS